MRKPKTHSEVAHQWASREIESASCSNMSFKNGIIYSYDWWPMAKFCKTEDGKEYVIMTSWSYSSSTSKHINHVKYAIPRNVPVYYSNERNSVYYGSREPILDDKSVLATMLNNIIFSYNRYMLPKTHGRYNSEELVIANYTLYNEAVAFSKMSNLPWNQDFDKYKISDHEIRIMQILATPVIKKREEIIVNKLEKERLRNEAYDRLMLKYGKNPMQMAKDWIERKSNNREWIEIPQDDPDAKLLGKVRLFQESETAMRIEYDQIVTNKGATISLNSGKRLWDMMKNNQSIIGEKCDIYTVLKNNGELVIGCHHIKREIIDFFVEYYKW